MGRVPIPLIARVLCRSEGAAEQRPVAVELGGRRLRVDEILEDAVHGSARAEVHNRRRVLVRLEDGQLLRLERELPAGEWRAYRVAAVRSSRRNAPPTP